MDIYDLSQKVCGEMQDGYTMKICMEDGAGWVEVENPVGENIIPPDFEADKTSFEEVVLNAFDLAQKAPPLSTFTCLTKSVTRRRIETLET